MRWRSWWSGTSAAAAMVPMRQQPPRQRCSALEGPLKVILSLRGVTRPPPWRLLDGASVTAAAAAAGHGYSRAGFYLVAAAFEQAGMSGLLDDKRGRRGPVKLTAEIVEFLQTAPPDRSGAELAVQVADRFGVMLHRRTVERARRR